MKGIVTRYRRENLAKITSGEISEIPKVSHIAFGSGGCENGEIKTPTEVQETLFNEVKRYPVGSVEIISGTTARYKVEIPANELNGVSINEIALVDEDGKLCAIKTFASKIKDEDMKFVFEFDDEF